jgi:hypothetical protein
MRAGSSHDDASLAPDDHPFYGGVDELLITRDLEIVDRLGCERILLPRRGVWPSHHIGGHVGRSKDGVLHAVFGGGEASMHWRSADAGVTWEGEELDTGGAGAFTVLDDDTRLLAVGGGNEPIRILRGIDGTTGWEPLAQIGAGLFDALHIDSNFLQLRDGTVLLAVNLRLDPPEREPLLAGQNPQYLLRSEDRGATWSAHGAADFWQSVKRGQASVDDDGPEYTWPGEGGTFPGVYETGFIELRDGRVLGAFRFSGPPRPWHRDVIADWGTPPDEPDAHGRIFRHIVLGESHECGRSWQNLRPVVDTDGRPLLAHGECNGELVELGDGRLVLVHQTRYAESFDAARGFFRGRSTLSARLSDDGGQTWRPYRYRVLYGFGYSGSIMLQDDTIVTAAGCSLGDNGDPRRAAVVRWRVD